MTNKEKLERDHKISRATPKKEKVSIKDKLEYVVDRLALTIAFLWGMFTSIVGHRNLLKNLGDLGSYAATVIAVLAISYIIFKNRKNI